MKATIYFLLHGLLLLLSGNVFAQSFRSGGTEVIPPSPNATSFITQSSETVQLYTGALNVKIPLVDLTSRELSHAVYLSYNGSGVKVNDIASWVGLGWTLNAGGVITRSMRGLPDEFNGQMKTPFSGGSFLEARGYLHTNVVGTSGQKLIDRYSALSVAGRRNMIDYSNKTGSFVTSGNPEVWDTEPDEFYFNFDSYSGKFVFDESGIIKIIPHQNLTITKVVTDKSIIGTNSQQITSFEITDPRGIKYVFGNRNVTASTDLTAVESTSYSLLTQRLYFGHFYLAENPTYYFWDLSPRLIVEPGGYLDIDQSLVSNYQQFISTWHLTKIQSPNKTDEINFDYANEDIKYLTSIEQDMDGVGMAQMDAVISGAPKRVFYTYKGITGSGAVESGNTTGKNGTSVARHMRQYVTFELSYNRIAAKKLTSITTASGNSIVFISQKPRVDLSGANALEKITARNNAGDIIKQFEFDYGITGPIEDNDFKTNLYRTVTSAGDVLLIPEYGYFDLGQAWDNDWLAMAYADHHRCFLTAIRETSNQTIANLKPYEFRYNVDEYLPRRLSHHQDLFGYYNNNPAGTKIPGFYGINWNWQQVGETFNSSDGSYLIPASPIATRTPLFEKMNVGALMEVIYPTGGKKMYVYEKNTITFPDSNPEGASGLRIKEIQSYPDAYKPEHESKFYSYQNGYAARSSDFLLFSQFHSLLNYTIDFGSGQTYDRKSYYMSTSYKVDQYFTRGSNVGYKIVEESRPTLGKKVYEFSVTDVMSDRSPVYNELLTTYSNGLLDKYPFARVNDLEHLRGNLLFESNYDNNNKLLSKISNTYSIDPEGFLSKESYGMKPGKNTLSGFNTYYAGFYKYVNYWVALTQTKTEVYDQLDPGNEEKKNTSIVSYSFVRPGQSVASPDLFVRKITNELPGSIKMVTENRYVTDFSPNTAYVNFLDEGTKGIYRLQQQQVQSELIETLSYKELIDNGSVVLQPLSGTVNIFKQFVSTPGQETVYLSEVKTFKPLVNSVVSAPMSYLDFGTAYELGSPVQKDNLIFRHSSQYKTTLKIDSYDNYGNPLSMTSADGVVKTMSWVNNNSLLGTLTSNAGPNQHQTTYQHKPMVGLTKAIDANGREIKYAFDAFSRLTTIRDHDNYIQTNYRYYLPGESLEMLSSAINVTGCKMRNQPINFNGGVGTQYGATTYEWNFGDGTSATNTTGTINHTYALTGVYTVSVKRTNPEYFGETTNTIQVVVDQPVASASLCADGIISYDVCNAVQPTTSQCQGGPPIQSRVTQTQPIRKRLPITKGLNVVGVQNPTLSVQTAGGSVTGFEWQYSINGGPWTPFGYGGRSVVGPPGYGDGISRGFAVRCIVTDTCGNSVTSDTLYLSAYASSQCF